MDPIGPAIQNSLAGVGQAERTQISERAVRERTLTRARRGADQAEFGDGMTPTEITNAITPAKHASDEDSSERSPTRDFHEPETRAPLDLEV